MSKNLLSSRRILVATLSCLAAVVLLMLAHPAMAKINPKFTPVDLVHDADQIIEVKLAPAVDNKIQATITRMIKGKNDAKTLTFDLSAPMTKEHGQAFSDAVKNRDNSKPCLFFVGPPADPDPEAPASDVAGMAYLHIDGIWVSFIPGEAGAWRMRAYNNQEMPETWRGGTDMLERAVDYILTDPDPETPSTEGVAFGDPSQFAKLEGVINACAPIDLAGDGTYSLFVSSESGDRFFSKDEAAKTLKDSTASHATPSKSKVFAWADFNGDGKIDLASSDGKTVTIYLQSSDGKFTAGPTLAAAAIGGPVMSLAIVAIETGEKPGLVIGTDSRILLWDPQGKSAPKILSDGSAAKEFGKASKILVADLDGDNIPDILQCFEKGSLICKGKAIGQFELPRAVPLYIGAGRADAFVGDFDADGLLDIVTISDDACRTWQNNGAFNFEETLLLSGEIGYKAAGGAIAGSTCDFNNDGRQDFALFYSTAKNPQMFFNRGFRSFVFAPELGNKILDSLPKDAQGEQQPQAAGCVGNFNPDGAQDMVVIMKNGECWYFPMATGDNTRALIASLPVKSSYVGPLTVTGWRNKRCLGAWNVIPGVSDAFVAWKEAGPLTLKWQFPGSPVQTKEFNVENKPVRVVLTPDGGNR